MIQHGTTTYKRYLILLLLYSGCSFISLTFYHYYPTLFLNKFYFQ